MKNNYKVFVGLVSFNNSYLGNQSQKSKINVHNHKIRFKQFKQEYISFTSFYYSHHEVVFTNMYTTSVYLCCKKKKKDGLYLALAFSISFSLCAPLSGLLSYYSTLFCLISLPLSLAPSGLCSLLHGVPVMLMNIFLYQLPVVPDSEIGVINAFIFAHTYLPFLREFSIL